MAVLYKLYQDNRDTSTHKGEWYARAKTLDTVTLNEIAQRIQDNTTAKKADALAVLTEMVEVVRDYLQKSYRVKIDGLGSRTGLVQDVAQDVARAHREGVLGIEEHQEHARPLPGGCDRRQERHAPPLPLQRSNR